MAINYSLALRSNPSDLDATPKYHATPQVTDVLDINQFAQHIADHGCVYSRADIQAILTMAVGCDYQVRVNLSEKIVATSTLLMMCIP